MITINIVFIENEVAVFIDIWPLQKEADNYNANVICIIYVGPSFDLS